MDPDDPIFRTPDKAVCPAHTEDEALAAFIAEHASLTYCDYCDVDGNEPIAVPLIELVEVITEAIGRYYGGHVP